MSCSVAIASSPAFSPSRLSISCKGSPENLALNPCSPSASPRSCSSSPFRPQRFQRAPSGLREVGAGIGTSSSPSGLAVDAPSSSSPPPSSSGGSCSVSKRKRPARINIPLAKALTFAPEVSDDWREVEAESARYTVYCKRGRKRLVMEDRHKVALDLNGDPKLAFFGIFDGHGGKRAAEFASENLGEFIAEEMVTTSGAGANDVAKAVRIGYLKTDAEFLKEEADGGACCVTALLRDGDLIVSNLGDCRAVLSRAGKAEALTSDHRPSREDERDRIESLDGYVDYFRGAWRLQGSLAISRAIGDSHLKQWVIPEPETRIINIEAECEFLILASDGLWDKVSIQEAVDVARPSCIDADSASSLSACKNLVDLSAKRGSLDDISVMIVKLQHYV
ncbi:probable protein phosphatase 2C 32 [Musa acuminata AAA Group]|uniref:probable protein phosphatase 2C 32 n=1 Tax=Musa acuminata AAA Group TaxID=214697 RepID=UPI0031D47906